MFTLMKLELKKFKLGWYVKGVIIANILIAALLVCIGYVEKLEGNVGISSYDEAFLIAGTLVRATFIIFAAVLITKFIIEEFKNKTTNVLFTYPVPRKKFIVVKLWIIGLLTFITIFISNVFVLVSIIVFDSYFEFIPGTFSTAALGQQLLSMVTFAFAAAGTSLIPLYFGMRKYSVPTTIISSILIVSLISSHNPVFSTASIVYIPLFLAVIGIVIAFWSIRNIEKVDMI
ncbi:ABC transporter permease [Siminovitchia sp. FSL W7-1587]|uniref:ABC transporter permease n=1 Tax=Siminovitchia sp. FSL W7-1587 TaxID=2954699 RepID=UPI0030D3A8DE